MRDNEGLHLGDGSGMGHKGPFEVYYFCPRAGFAAKEKGSECYSLCTYH